MHIISEWDLSRKTVIVITDNAANITNAIQNILKWKHFVCYAHTLNVIVQDRHNQKSKNYCDDFKRSNSANLKLTQYQEQIRVQQPKKLLQDVVTCWILFTICLNNLFNWRTLLPGITSNRHRKDVYKRQL